MKYRVLATQANGEPGELFYKVGTARKMAAYGEIVDDLPKVSIPGLLEKGWLEEVTDGDKG